MRRALAGLALALGLCAGSGLVEAQTGAQAGAQAGAASAATTPGWTVAGSLGVMQFVVVPADEAGDETAYRREWQRLCGSDATCFLRFFTNSRGLAITMPLDDAILSEPTARYQRSGKRGAEVFEWSCRVQPTRGDCF